MDAIIFKIEFYDKPLDAVLLLNTLSEHLFDEDKNEGYTDIMIENKYYVSGLIVNKIPTLLNVYDVELQAIVKKEEIIISNINFSIDVANNLFEVFTSSMRDAKRAHLTLSHTFKGKARISHYDIPIASTLLKIKEGFKDVEFSKLNIKNFKLEEYAEGYIEIKNIKSYYAWVLIENYKNNITKTVILINYIDHLYILSISESGKLKITSKNKLKTNHFFEVLKGEIFKNN